MNKATLAMVVALAANVVFAGLEDWQYSLYSASFETYSVGEDLDSTKGAVGGTWGNPPMSQEEKDKGAYARAQQDSAEGKYLDCTTVDEGIAFTPYDTGYRFLKTVTTRVRLSAYETDGGNPPAAPEGARAAFAVYSDGSAVVFKGLETTKAGRQNWVSLYGSMEPAKEGEWYDVSMKFIIKQDDSGKSVRVQYRLKNERGEYETLRTDGGETWLTAEGDPSREVASKIEYRGDGGIKYLGGGEPKRGLLIGLVPWREVLVDETVYSQGTGSWAAFDPESGNWLNTPYVYGGAYVVNVADGADGYAFIPKDMQSGALKTVEFAVRFSEPNDNDTVPDDVSALVRVVEEPMMDLKQTTPGYRFACLVKGGWYTNENIVAELDADYTVEISQDDKGGTVSYRIRRGHGGEGGVFQTLLDKAPMPIYSPFYAFFGGHGFVYEIKSSVKKSDK